MLTPEEEMHLDRRLQAIHHRLQWLANAEARATWLKGHGAHGEFSAEKEALIAETEALLERWEKD
jgi:hypothetical protein